MKIALITTLPSLEENLRLATETKAMGHDFRLVDQSQFSFTIKSNTLKVKNLSNLKADLIIVRGIFSSIKTLSAIISSLTKRGTKIFDNNFLNHRYAIDKVTDMTKLALADLPVPDTIYTRNIDGFSDFGKRLGFPLVIKSTRMGKGAGVFLINNKSHLVKFTKQILQEGKVAKNFLAQQYIPYVHDLRVLIIGDKTFTMKRIPANGEFRANFSLGGSVEPFDLDKKGIQLAQDALKTVNMTVGGVDILIDPDDNRYVLEVNHTAGFVGMESTTGKNIAKLFIEHAIKNAK